MSAMQPTTHPLMERLLRELQQRNIDLDAQARAAVEQEFQARLTRNPDPKALLGGWDRNLRNYVDLLDGLSRQYRKKNGLTDDAPITLDAQQVQETFAICSKLCPGPA